MSKNRKNAGTSSKGKKSLSGPTIAKSLSGLIGLLTAFGIWYFSHCYEERKEVIPVVKQAFADRREAQDQVLGSADAAIKATFRFVDYVKSDRSINKRMMRNQIAQIEYLYQQAYADCNKSVQATNRYVDAETALSDVFLIPIDVGAQRVDGTACSCWSDDNIQLVSFDPTSTI
jgi:hypothetical protein